MRAYDISGLLHPCLWIMVAEHVIFVASVLLIIAPKLVLADDRRQPHQTFSKLDVLLSNAFVLLALSRSH
jgi:hypothetical protein